jgi:Putative peptidoglycan binding domain
MRIFVITICSLALATGAYSAQQEENKQQKKKKPQTVQHAPAATTAHPTAHPTGHPTGAGANPKHTSIEAYHGQQGIKGHPSTEAYHGQKGNKGQTPMGPNEVQTGKAAKGGKVTGTAHANNAAAATANAGKPLKPQYFNVSKQPNTAKAPPVKFQQGRLIEGSQNWQGQQYTVFRNYRSEWHDQNWWHNHHNRIVFVFGAPYYWNAGYWFPAWGYYPNAYYAWDGPIYAYNNLPPDQVIANVQATLQQHGYYQGEVDGLIGPLTRAAIADYQRDHGLYMTSTIDQPTLQSLGMA